MKTKQNVLPIIVIVYVPLYSLSFKIQIYFKTSFFFLTFDSVNLGIDSDRCNDRPSLPSNHVLQTIVIGC